MFESLDQLLLGLLTGVAFGFLLQKGQVAKYQTILGQLLLRDWTVLKVMGTAVAVGAVGVCVLVEMGVAHLDIWPLLTAGVLLGAVLFGIGLALFGYCPGTGLAGSGEGSRDAMFGVLGMFVSALVFVAAYPLLDPFINSLGDNGKLTWPGVLGVSPWVLIGALLITFGGVFWILERRRTRATTHLSNSAAAASSIRYLEPSSSGGQSEKNAVRSRH